MTYDNARLAHTWAQQNHPLGKTPNGNFNFDGTSLFSYRTEIARFIDGMVIYTSNTYSATTSGKHMPALRNAISHLESYTVPCDIRELPTAWDGVAPIVYTDMLSRLLNQIESIKTKRSYIVDAVAHISMIAHQIVLFESRYSPSLTTVIYPDTLSLPIIMQLDNETSSNHTHSFTIEILENHFGINIASKLAKEQATLAQKLLKEQKQRELQALKDAEKIPLWRSGEYALTLYNLPVMLRIDGNQVLTSHGARVPLDQAKRLYEALIDQVASTGTKIGDFTVRDINEEFITIGCHKIPLSEAHTLFATKE